MISRSLFRLKGSSLLAKGQNYRNAILAIAVRQFVQRVDCTKENIRFRRLSTFTDPKHTKPCPTQTTVTIAMLRAVTFMRGELCSTRGTVSDKGGC